MQNDGESLLVHDISNNMPVQEVDVDVDFDDEQSISGLEDDASLNSSIVGDTHLSQSKRRMTTTIMQSFKAGEDSMFFGIRNSSPNLLQNTRQTYMANSKRQGLEVTDSQPAHFYQDKN